jgi:hypothetical protein
MLVIVGDSGFVLAFFWYAQFLSFNSDYRTKLQIYKLITNLQIFVDLYNDL